MKNKLLLIAVSFVVFTLLFSSGVLADYHKINESRRNDYTARLKHISCRIELTKTQLDIFSVANSSVLVYKAPLDADYSKLQELANLLNHKEFDRYFTTTFKDNLKNAVKAVQAEKFGIKKTNITMQQKLNLKSLNKETIAAFANCTNNADKNWSNARADHLNSWITRWNNIIAKMKEKGYDTAEMEVVVADAQNMLLPAIEAVRSATKKDIRTSMENARNLHLHLWARFEIARINTYLKSIESEAALAGYTAEISAIKAKLDQASNTAVTGKKYREGEFETVWSLIKDATKMLKELNKKLKENAS
ncbi:hypothetical protein HYV49_05090 [Candidatus Pacearchaeota archaeon]|nr:hypothetical protein [Candidatus Pacearchaeota archaeon]